MKFSVIIPTYNRREMVDRLVREVLRQDYDDFEVIVVDDGSNDGTLECIGEIGDPRLRVLPNVRKGATEARNLGFRNSNGDFLVFLDSDDMPLPGWLARFAKLLGDRNRCSLACCAVLVREGSSEECRVPYHMLTRIRYGKTLFLAGAFAVARDLFEQINGYDVDLQSGHHTDLALRLLPLLHYQGRCISSTDVAGVIIVKHSGERIRLDSRSVLSGTEKILLRYSSLLTKRAVADYCGVAALAASRLGKKRIALGFATRALLNRPFRPVNWMRLCKYAFFSSNKLHS